MDALVAKMRIEFLPLLSEASQRGIATWMACEATPYWPLDDMLQDALIEDVPMSAELLAEIEEALDSGDYDPEIIDRTRGWLFQHKQRQLVT